MNNKHNAKRSDFKDSQIMDALDQGDYNITAAARLLGLHVGTLRNWVIKSPNLSKYQAYKQAEGAVKAREKLEEMLESEEGSVLLGVCKVLLDKYEPDLLKTETDQRIEIDHKLESKIKDLLGE